MNKPSDGEQIAKAFHEAYERLASQFGYQTRPESAVPWEQVPENNRRLMIASVTEALRSQPQGWRDDMENAPRDGTRVILWSAKWTAPCSGQLYGDSWRVEYGCTFKDQPTHWQPNLAPPTQKEPQ